MKPIFKLIFVMLLATFALNWVYGSDLDVDIAVTTGYDDNILNYSDGDLDQIDDTTVTDNKYGLESISDFIITPEIELVLKQTIGKHSTHFGVNARYYYYLENDIKRYYRIRAFIRRYLKRGTYLEGTVSYLPDYYYRNSYSSEAGYQEAEFNKLSARLKLSAKVMKSSRLNLFYTYANKDFIPVFDERDIDGHEFGGELIYYKGRAWKAWGAFTFSTYAGAGADNPEYQRDTSYDSFDFRLGSKFYFKGMAQNPVSIGGLAIYKKSFFQTDKISSADRYRFGREDDRIEIRFSVEHGLTDKLTARAGFNYVSKKTDLPAQELEELLEYSSNSFNFKLNYSF